MTKAARLTGSAPVLLVRDVHRAVAHYKDKMGFAAGRIWGDPPSFTILGRDGMHLMLKQIGEPRHIVPRRTVSDGLWDVYFWVDDVQALYTEFTGRGATTAYPPCDQPYGCREFAVRDLDGHEIGFGQIIA